MKKRTRFLSDNKALAAIEFAFVLPIMITMILGAIEYSRAYYYQMKASKISGAIADAITISVPYYASDGSSLGPAAADCATNNLVLTDYRLKEIISDENIEVMASPLSKDRVFIEVTSIYNGYGTSSDNTCRLAELKFATKDGQFCPGNGLFYLTWTANNYTVSGSTQVRQNTLDINTSVRSSSGLAGFPGSFRAGAGYEMFPGENIIKVKVKIKLNSIIGGGLSLFVPAYNDGQVEDTSYYSPRNYNKNTDGKIQGGLFKLKTGGTDATEGCSP